MKLLFATSLLPGDQATSGYEIANRAILYGLRALGHDVVPIGFTNLQHAALATPGSVVLGDLSVTNSDATMQQKLVWLKRAIQNETSFAGAKLQIITPQALASMIARHGNFDGIIVNGAPMAAAFEKVLTGKPFIYVAHNVEWLTAAQSANTASSFSERLLFAREAKMLKALEQRLAAKANHILTLAGDDCQAFQDLGAKSVSSVPLIVGLEGEQPGKRTLKYDAGLIGTWSWVPNRVGLDWFLNEVVPHLPADYSFAIAGKLDGKLAGSPAIKHPGAVILGRVQSALEFTRSCGCLPLVSRAGTGIQLKTLEVFELGLPSVATSSSVRGVAAVPQNCTIEDDPKLFAEALLAHKAKHDHSDLDGRQFHAGQKAKMLEALAEGLSSFAARPLLQAAE